MLPWQVDLSSFFLPGDREDRGPTGQRRYLPVAGGRRRSWKGCWGWGDLECVLPQQGFGRWRARSTVTGPNWNVQGPCPPRGLGRLRLIVSTRTRKMAQEEGRTLAAHAWQSTPSSPPSPLLIPAILTPLPLRRLSLDSGSPHCPPI